LGNPPDKLERVTKAVAEGLDKVLDFIKPGVTCEAVEENS
ncbi:unnamed protein product, partial [marine sediment metagenome]